ncbi:MAG: TatD family hydrolase [Coriobacteriia bacterium]|nr:TatD family hydrolase [Coriobacteriia bacterium]
MADFPETPWQDLGYWQKRKKDKWRRMPAPVLVCPVVDTHCHLDTLSDPAYALARAACLGVGELCTISDPTESYDITFDALDSWIADARNKAAFLVGMSQDFALPGVMDTVDETEYLGRWNEAFAISSGGSCSMVVGEDTLEQGKVPSVPKVHIGIGCHPHNARLYTDEVEGLIRERCKDSRVAVIGEIGLDYHYDLSPHETQRECFRRQLRLAHELSMPVALHVREAHDEALEILSEEGFPEKGVLLHCCSLSPDEVKPWVEAGCWIAYGGPITFANGDDARAGACCVPLDRLLTETDSPYMTPVPLRGVACLPDYVAFNAERLASVVASHRGIDETRALKAFAENAQSFLNQGPFPCQAPLS